MSLRMRDFHCKRCGRYWEEIQQTDAKPPMHCGRRAIFVIVGGHGGIHYRRHYSHALGHVVNSSLEEDREMQKKGWWFASAREANDAANTDHFDAPVAVQKQTKERLRKVVEQQAEKLVRDGRIAPESLTPVTEWRETHDRSGS